MPQILNQYKAIKDKYPDAILLFRVNDFYECFYQDAITISSILDLVLTHNKLGVEMCGFPAVSLDAHLPRLVKAGFRVAICDQLSAPAENTTERSISRAIAPKEKPGCQLTLQYKSSQP